MILKIYFFCTVLCSFLLQGLSSAFLEDFTKTTVCDNHCDETFPSVDYRPSCCKNGCKLFTIIALSKDQIAKDKLVTLCTSGCSEEYKNATAAQACHVGCKKEATEYLLHSENQQQTLHVLTPLMYIRGAYNTIIHHMKQFIATSWTVYVEEDSGKMVVLQSNPKVIVETPGQSSNSDSKYHVSGLSSHSRDWREERADWVDCISHQSGLPRWLLVVVLFGFIMALLWLCCATTVTAPNQHIASHGKKISPKNDLGYLLLYEPVDEVKIQPGSDEQAPPLPPKVSLI